MDIREKLTQYDKNIHKSCEHFINTNVKIGTLIVCFEKGTNKLYSTRIVVNKKNENFYYLKHDINSNKLHMTNERICSWHNRPRNITYDYKFINKK